MYEEITEIKKIMDMMVMVDRRYATVEAKSQLSHWIKEFVSE
jgi:hypothetical protein